MLHRYTEPFPIYDSILFDIIIADNNEEISAILNPEDRDEEYYACVSRTYIKQEKEDEPALKAVTVIFNKDESGYNLITSKIIVHEAVHIKNKVFMTIGHKNDRDNDEPEAYFVEWIFDKISQEIEVYNKLKDEQQNNTASDK